MLKVLRIKVFDFMIENELYRYDVDPWNGGQDSDFFCELKGEETGQLDYNDEIFVVTYIEGTESRGGMDMETPDIFQIIRIKK